MALTMTMNNRYVCQYLYDGKVQVRGFDIEYSDYATQPGKTVSDVFNSQFHNLDHDLVDFPIINYLIARDLGRPLVAIPTFPTMFFPHMGPMVNRKSGIKSVDDLAGKKVGVMGLAYNPATWFRGVMVHQYDVSYEQMVWVEGEPNSTSGVDYPRSRRFKVEKAKGVVKMLDEGAVDAVILPDGGFEPTEKVDRLFSGTYKEIRAYYEATSVFPINSVVAVKRDVVVQNPGLVKAVVNAFGEAWERYCADAKDEDEHMGLNVGELRKMGLFPHQDGLEANRKALKMIIQYAYEQGFIKRLRDPEELFAKI